MKDSNLGGFGDYDGFGWDGMGDPVPGGPWHPMYGALASGVGTGVTIAIEEFATDSPTLQKYAELIGLGADAALAIGGYFYAPARAASLTLLAAGIANHLPRQTQKMLAAGFFSGSQGVGMPALVQSRRLGLGESRLVPRGNTLGAPRTRLLGQTASAPGRPPAGARILNAGVAAGHFGHSTMSR